MHTGCCGSSTLVSDLLGSCLYEVPRDILPKPSAVAGAAVCVCVCVCVSVFVCAPVCALVCASLANKAILYC